jgi:hypothetical protein
MGKLWAPARRFLSQAGEVMEKPGLEKERCRGGSGSWGPLWTFFPGLICFVGRKAREAARWEARNNEHEETASPTFPPRPTRRELELMGIKQLQLVLTGAVYCKETGK